MDDPQSLTNSFPQSSEPVSPKQLTEAQRLQRQAAGRNRRKREQAAPAAPGAPPPTGPLRTISDYDRILGRVVTWSDAKRREEVRGEILSNRAKRDERKRALGKLFDRDQVQERERKLVEIVLDELQKLGDLTTTMVDSSQRQAVLQRTLEWVAGCRQRIADRVAAGTKP